MESQPIHIEPQTGLELTQEGVIVLDRHGRAAYADAGFFRMLGRSRDVENPDYSELLTSVQFAGGLPFEDVLQTVSDSGEWAGEAAGLTGENHAILLDVRITQLPGQSKSEGLGAVLVARDVTRSRAMATQVFAAQRMELIETFTRGLTHAFKNQLTIIMAYGSLLSRMVGQNGGQEEINHIVNTAEQANELMDLMGVLTKSHPLRMEDCDINDTLSVVRVFLDKSAPPNILVSMPDYVSAPAIHVDPVELQRVVLNLALNGIDAMPKGGTLSLDVEMARVTKEDLSSYPLDEAGDYVILSVADAGRGFTEEARRRAFEPFFTTKERGNGLGLCSIHRSLAGMDAVLRIYSEPDEGTCVRIYLPISASASQAFYGSELDAERAEKVSGSILVIDDDDVTRNLFRKFLKRAGYRVTSSHSGMEGISTYKKKYAEIDLVLLDVVMPNLNGKETLGRLQDVRRDVPVLMISGFPRRAVQELMENDNLPCLTKPFTEKALLSAVSAILSA